MKKLLKKIVLSIWIFWVLWIGWFGLVNAAIPDPEPNTNVDPANSWMPKQNTVYKINQRGINESWNNYLLTNAIKLVDWVMSLLSVVTLVVLLIWGFKMITANWDDWKYKKWFTILKHAAIWLIIIWLSRAIIRLIFRFIKKTDTDANYDTNS